MFPLQGGSRSEAGGILWRRFGLFFVFIGVSPPPKAPARFDRHFAFRQDVGIGRRKIESHK